MKKIFKETNELFGIEQAHWSTDYKMDFLHCHKTYELFFMQEGRRRMIMNDKLIELRANDVQLIRPGVFHANCEGTTFKRVCVFFSQLFISKYFTSAAREQLLKCFENNVIHLEEAQAAKANKILSRLLENKNEEKAFLPLAQLLALLGECAASDADFEVKRKNSVVDRALEYIEKNYASIETISDIADAVFVTKQYLCTAFRAATGRTLTEYLNMVKVKHACKMLVDTDKTVTEIGFLCGFNSTMYFCRIFGKLMEETPTQFRKNA